ncbi:MAG TPA: glucose-6-phosphate dehydrogenase [Solirubrobacterales bacterium]|jgi:glucose-6-phosphate 1-dehydrogenase|nr:glucose-6-phosphate dehydrogenase [Solirubrobacterales bacterium]
MAVNVAEAPRSTASPTIPDDQVIVLFGATGDLAKRKLLPGIFHLFEAGLMPERFVLIGASRSGLSEDEFVALVRDAVCGSGRRPEPGESLDRFVESLRFAALGDGFGDLGTAVVRAREELAEDAQLLHYLSLPPVAYAGVIEGLGQYGLGKGARVIMEKPFGRDLASARELDALVHTVFDEEQVFRIDHYLGREAVQNLLALRFANGMFEPIWNRNHIDHIQIDIPETLSIGMRGSFYEETGAFRDMIVTHLFQLLSFVAMEPPTSLSPKALMAERGKVFDSMLPLEPGDVVRGQYAGYRDEEGVAAESDTETFVALRAYVDNWRWEGIPFFLRSGKRLAENHHLLTIAFSEPPRRMFPIDCTQVAERFGHDHLTFELGDPGSISASFLAKVPGPKMRLGEAQMRFDYADSFGGPAQALDAYERLIHDVMVGDRTLFTTSEAIERLWEIADPVVREPPPVEIYEPGSWGPEGAADALLSPHRWHAPMAHS